MKIFIGVRCCVALEFRAGTVLPRARVGTRALSLEQLNFGPRELVSSIVLAATLRRSVRCSIKPALWEALRILRKWVVAKLRKPVLETGTCGHSGHKIQHSLMLLQARASRTGPESAPRDIRESGGSWRFGR